MIAPTDQAEMNSAPAIQLEIEGGPKPPQGGWSQTVTDEKDAVKITLSDCLACSGCVTSAETVRAHPTAIYDGGETVECLLCL